MKSAKEWQEVWPGDVHAAEKLIEAIRKEQRLAIAAELRRAAKESVPVSMMRGMMEAADIVEHLGEVGS